MAFSFIGSNSASAASGTSAAITHGLTINDGDLVIVDVNSNNDASTIADTTGSGATFSAAYSNVQSSESNTWSLLWKIAASEPAAYSFSHGASARWGVTIMVFRPDSGTPEVDATDSDFDAAVNSFVDLDSITVSAGAVAIAVTHRDRSIGAATPSIDNSYTGLITAADQYTVMAYRIYASGGATGVTRITHTSGTDDEDGWAHVAWVEAGGGGGIIPQASYHLLRNTGSGL